MSQIEQIDNLPEKSKIFNLPIDYVSSNSVPLSLIDDLELVKFKGENDSGFYNEILKPETSYGNKIANQWSLKFTKDKKFLKESQVLYKNYNTPLNVYEKKKLEDIEKIWADIKNDTSFIEKFHYVEYEFLQHLNESAPFLQILTTYNLLSPVLSILLPIIFIIMPFFILKIQGIAVSFSRYIEVLKQIAGKHAIGQIFALTSEISWEKRFYIFISIGFYVFQIYQNFMCCISFYNRMKLMHEYIFDIKYYIDYIIEKMDDFIIKSVNLSTYTQFNCEVKKHKKSLINLKSNINNITPFSHNLNKVMQIGSTMQIFYVLHKNEEYNDAMLYSMSFTGYIDNIHSINRLHKNNCISPCIFTNKFTKFKNAYYPLVDKPVKNNYNLKKQLIITGPNAAGKTTLLKTTTINILLSQQWGYGFYKKCSINPYTHIHCYLNIPDTSGRDSLFQAEARRCKGILDKIITSPSHERHFCIFDELYSGTNPYEAVASSYSFLDYLTKRNNNTFMLTTHFIELCNKLEKNFNVKNCHMSIHADVDNFKYKYKLVSGISNVKGGIRVLENLDYPECIINKANQELNS